MSVSYNARDALLYAVSIGCAKESRTAHDSNHSDLRFIYEQDPNFAAFPTFPITLAMKGATQDIDATASSNAYLGKNPKPKRDPNKAPVPRLKVKGVITGVDAERYIERVHDIPLFDVQLLKISTRTIGISQKGKNMLTESESELVGANGTVFTKFQGAGMSIGGYGFKDSGRTNSGWRRARYRAGCAGVLRGTSPSRSFCTAKVRINLHIERMSGSSRP